MLFIEVSSLNSCNLEMVFRDPRPEILRGPGCIKHTCAKTAENAADIYNTKLANCVKKKD